MLARLFTMTKPNHAPRRPRTPRSRRGTIIVLAFDNLDPIPDGSLLYTCAIALAADAAPGTYALVNAEQGSSAAGGLVLPTDGADGAVEVLSASPAAAIVVGTAAAEAGMVASLPVSIDVLDDALVAGVQVDLGFDAATPVALAGTRPDCTVAAAIGKEATSFAFLPTGCTPGDDCTGVRAFVLSLANADPLPDGALLFTCAVAIAADATPGSYPVTATQPRASGPLGEELPALAVGGAVVVEDGPPPLPCVGDCDGDGVVAINELLIGVNMAAGTLPPSQCPAFSPDGEVPSIAQLIQAVNAAVTGCP